MIEKLTNSEKIVSLLDGELGAEESKEFYNELSQNETLQSQMNEFIEINKMVRSTRPTLPSAVKLGVMVASGFGKSIFTTTGAIISYVGTLIIGTILYFSVFSSEEIVEADLLISEKSTKMTEQITTNNSDFVVAKVNKLTESSKSNNIVIKSTESKRTSDIFQKSNKINNFNTSVSDYSENTAQNISEKIIPNITNSDIIPNVPSEIPVISDVVNFGNIFYKSAFSELSSSNFLQNKSIRLMYNGLNSQDVYPNNFAISVSSKVSDSWEVGLIMGLENIIQKFEYSNKIETRIYEQNYNAFWGGITLQYTENLFSGSDFSYYGRGTFGAIKTGPLARLELGMQYELMNGFRVYTGFEMMGTGYLFKNKLFSSGKNGLTFGFDLNAGVFK